MNIKKITLLLLCTLYGYTHAAHSRRCCTNFGARLQHAATTTWRALQIFFDHYPITLEYKAPKKVLCIKLFNDAIISINDVINCDNNVFQVTVQKNEHMPETSQVGLGAGDLRRLCQGFSVPYYFTNTSHAHGTLIIYLTLQQVQDSIFAVVATNSKNCS